MIVYIRSMKDWSHIGHHNAVSYDLPIASDSNNDTGTVVIAGEHKDITGEWLIIDGRIYMISKCSPSNGQTSITVSSPANALDRTLEYSGTGSETFGSFIASTITSEYINQSDELYKREYLSVSTNDSTEFSFPVKAGETYKLTDILSLAREKDVLPEWFISSEGILLKIMKIDPETRTIIFGDGRSSISSETYTNDLTAKVTVKEVREEEDESITVLSTATYYWHDDGQISEEIPEPRIDGKWEIVHCKEGEEKLNSAIDAMSGNESSFKIEFYSDRDLGFHDQIRVKTESGFQSGKISYKKISSKDSRFFYKVGRAITTLTEKLSQEEK